LLLSGYVRIKCDVSNDFSRCKLIRKFEGIL